jgi:hypothetical protein
MWPKKGAKEESDAQVPLAAAAKKEIGPEEPSELAVAKMAERDPKAVADAAAKKKEPAPEVPSEPPAKKEKKEERDSKVLAGLSAKKMAELDPKAPDGKKKEGLAPEAREADAAAKSFLFLRPVAERPLPWISDCARQFPRVEP